MSIVRFRHLFNKILIVSLQSKFDSVERRLVEDVDYLQSLGIEVIFCGHRSTFLDQYLPDSTVKKYYLPGNKGRKFFSISLVLLIQKIVKQEKIDLVHTYDFKIIWSLAFALRAEAELPLILSQYTDVPRRFQSFFYRTLASRIDKVLIPLNELTENIIDQTPINPRKIVVTGLGITHLQKKAKVIPGESTRERFFIGLKLERGELISEAVLPILIAISGFHGSKKVQRLDNEICLIIVHDFKGHSDPAFLTLKERILELNLGESVFLTELQEGEEIYSKVHVWLTSSRQIPISDAVLGALCSGVPVVLPRSSLTWEFLMRHPGVGESYKAGDSREVKVKLTKLILEYPQYRKSVALMVNGIQKEHDQQKYQDLLILEYQNALLKRRRYLEKKRKLKKINPSPNKDLNH